MSEISASVEVSLTGQGRLKASFAKMCFKRALVDELITERRESMRRLRYSMSQPC